MKAETLKKRLNRNRPMTTITIRIPEDVIEDLKKVAPIIGFRVINRSFMPILGKDFEPDIERLEGDTVSALIASLKRHGVSNEVIEEALKEVSQQ